MSCAVCAGYSSYNCPCCSEDVVMVDCPDCANGVVYYAFNIKTRKDVRVTEIAYMLLPFDEDCAEFERQNYCQGDIRICPTCKGEGEIPEEY